ncbi:methyltransferase domain-containing protein [Thermosynechococcus sp. PKX82]|uniref:class I SAM-dependent methyltransferase n=1 Tax=Thermosynechococcus sp. PKX82 TaxID=3074086 RepID=UPI0028734429|nr:methyltransferase domain-containing protein [Thermosynechococcus sp. PKX82]WNC29641.1 methyltransferase domain-containing protein [Thermosynechococcus sp. PKX82]
MQSQSLKLVNVGCGQTFHPEWLNFDVAPAVAGVKRWDIRRGLPFKEEEVDAVYSSHVLEHLSCQEAENFLRDAYRVLKPNGVLRIVVPDLEQTTRAYLAELDALRDGRQTEPANYEWLKLELLDQLVRHHRGGAMAAYLLNPNIPNPDFVRSRIGQEAEDFFKVVQQPQTAKSFLKKILRPLRHPRELLAKILVWPILGKRGVDALSVGLFRLSGEAHLWMYDGYSLKLLVEACGFHDCRVVSAFESCIPDFSRYNLDVVDGQVRKPDSLFMEATKPVSA